MKTQSYLIQAWNETLVDLIHESKKDPDNLEVKGMITALRRCMIDLNEMNSTNLDEQESIWKPLHY